jgi:hypothetical protein
VTASAKAGGGKIVVLCEGDTEEVAVRHFVTRQWHADNLRSVSLRPVNLSGKLQHIGVKAKLFHEEDVRAVFTLVDLYGMERVSHDPNDPLQAKVIRVTNWLARQVDHPRTRDFFPHVSVHETEAWLLAEGLALARRLGDARIGPEDNAEVKNFQKPPSTRLHELFRSRRRGDGYHKISDGVPLFKALQFDPVYKSCRYFAAFYDDLKSVALR